MSPPRYPISPKKYASMAKTAYPTLISPLRTEEAARKYEEEKDIHPELPSNRSGVVLGVESKPAAPSVSGATEVTNRLDKVVGQLNIITKTLSILEQRMRTTEGQVAQLFERVNEPRTVPKPGEEAKEPAANPLIEAERYDVAGGYASGHFKAEEEQMEARMAESAEQRPVVTELHP